MYGDPIYSTNYNPKPSFLLGLGIERNINDKHSIKTGLFYERKGVTNNYDNYVDTSGAPIAGKHRLSLNQTYLSVPLHIKRNFKKWYLYGGGYLGFLATSNIKRIDTVSKKRITVDNIADYKKIDGGLSFGLGSTLYSNKKLKVDGEFRINQGLMKISEIVGNNARTSNVLFVLSIKRP